MSTTTQNAVATTAPPAQPQGTLGRLQGLLDQYKKQIAVALPRHLTPERMIRVALTAVSTTPSLQECTPLSIAACVVQSSILGLEPSAMLGEAYLVPFNVKVKDVNGKERWEKQCQLIPGYQGLLKLVRNSGELLMVNAQVVKKNDRFDFEDGLDPYLVHKRADGDRGEVVAYWAGAVLKGGGKQFVVMSKTEVLEHGKRFSKTFDKGPWNTDFDAMALKTCLRRLCKLLPKSIEAQMAVSLDERAEAGLTQQFSVEVPIELQPQIGSGEPETSTVAMPERKSDQSAPTAEPAPAAAQPPAKPPVLVSDSLPEDAGAYDPNTKIRVGSKLYTNGTAQTGWVLIQPPPEVKK